jgi:hypothetical protein
MNPGLRARAIQSMIQVLFHSRLGDDAKEFVACLDATRALMNALLHRQCDSDHLQLSLGVPFEYDRTGILFA